MTKIPKFYPTFPEPIPLKENVVGEARKFINTLEESIKYSGVYNSLGINSDKTFLLQSKPGLGKSLGIKAINNSMNNHIYKKLNEIDKKTGEKNTLSTILVSDFNLLLFEYDIGRYGTAYINMSSKIIQSFFDTAFSCSMLGKTTLIGLDECDALISSRKSSIQSHSEDRKVLETIMKNLQTAHDKENVYVVMMTNTPEIIDTASIRAGRIDRKITFNLPKYDERKLAYEDAIDKVNKRAGYQVIRLNDYANLSEISKGFNYADIYQSVENSLRRKAKELIKNKKPGIMKIGYIKQGKLEKAILNHRTEFVNKKEKTIGFI